MRIIILHNIRSAHNVGSIFRTADAAGISHVYLTGYTPTPTDRFGRRRKDIAKVALGAERHVEWTYIKDIKELIETLQHDGVHVVAVEQAGESRDYREFTEKGNVAYIVGNEVDGISENILDLCDSIVEIPMRGQKTSLNVAVATGIILFQH